MTDMPVTIRAIEEIPNSIIEAMRDALIEALGSRHGAKPWKLGIIAAFLAAEAADYKLVPRDPTSEMIVAAVAPGSLESKLKRVWDAAPSMKGPGNG